MLMKGKKGLIVGVANKMSIAYGIAEQLKNEINLQKDIPWLKEEVMSQIRGRGMFSIICDISMNI